MIYEFLLFLFQYSDQLSRSIYQQLTILLYTPIHLYIPVQQDILYQLYLLEHFGLLIHLNHLDVLIQRDLLDQLYPLEHLDFLIQLIPLIELYFLVQLVPLIVKLVS
jgi:hypothetical protein